jgi:hypothetical protein
MLDQAMEAVRLDRKAEKDRKNATIRLQFTVPVDKAGAVCDFVAALLQPTEGEG